MMFKQRPEINKSGERGPSGQKVGAALQVTCFIQKTTNCTFSGARRLKKWRPPIGLPKTLKRLKQLLKKCSDCRLKHIAPPRKYTRVQTRMSY